MKLRNKKTGEIVDLSIFGITLNIRKEEQPTYHSIEGVCEDWEDADVTIVRTKNRIEFLERKLKYEKALLEELCGEDEE